MSGSDSSPSLRSSEVGSGDDFAVCLNFSGTWKEITWCPAF